jgi:hypothetical protein
MRDLLFPPDDPKALRAADLVFVDSIARPRVKHSKILEYLRTAMKSYQLRLRA